MNAQKVSTDNWISENSKKASLEQKSKNFDCDDTVDTQRLDETNIQEHPIFKSNSTNLTNIEIENTNIKKHMDECWDLTKNTIVLSKITLCTNYYRWVPLILISLIPCESQTCTTFSIYRYQMSQKCAIISSIVFKSPKVCDHFDLTLMKFIKVCIGKSSRFNANLCRNSNVVSPCNIK